MRDKLVAIVLFFFVASCSEENVPAGIYDYQVERLLTGPFETKDWGEVISSINCDDSVKLRFELAGDSIDISQLLYNSSCGFDITYIGRANASSFPERDLFTDSLIFSDGGFWLVREVTSQLLTIEVNEEKTSYRSGI